MNDRQRTILIIISFLSFISVILAGVKLYPIANKWQEAIERAKSIKIGTDNELEETINFLEKRLKNRLDYKFVMDNKPMLLTNVIYLTNSGGRRLRSHRRSQVRITHIINGQNRYVGVQHMGQNFTLVEGDSVAGGAIVRIESDGMIFSKDGQEKYIQLITNNPENLNGTQMTR